jgi:aminoglycoside/choline kinase family phosphotransferase
MLKTPGFYEYVARARIEKKLGGADRFAEAHFDGPSPYQSEIERNIVFLRRLVEAAELGRLRRLCYSLSTKPVSRPASALSA